MFKKIKNLLLLFAYTIILTGCMQYDLSMKINDDKSMDFVLIETVEQSLLNEDGTLKNEGFGTDSLPSTIIDFEELKKIFIQKGYTVESYTDPDKPTHQGAKIFKHFEDIDKISKGYKDKLIRFHVLANSDSDEDQELKLKVRDEIIKYLQPMLKQSKSLEQSEQIILSESENIKNIGENIIKENGYTYEVEVKLEYNNFPAKQYSNIVLPAGEYKALRILIGEAKGKNWWCVMFPPLCFVDENNGVIDKETDEKLRSVLTKEEYNLIAEDNIEKTKDVKMKFKIVEIIEALVSNSKN